MKEKLYRKIQRLQSKTKLLRGISNFENLVAYVDASTGDRYRILTRKHFNSHLVYFVHILFNNHYSKTI